MKRFAITDVQYSGKVVADADDLGIVLNFGEPEIPSFLLENQAIISPPELDHTNLVWFNFKLQLQTTELIPAFDDPALMLMQEDAVIFAISAFQFNSLTVQSRLLAGWLPLSLKLTKSPLRLFAGDNGDLSNPTTARIIVESVSSAPVYQRDFLTSENEPQFTVTTISDQEKMWLVDQSVAWPYYLAHCWNCAPSIVGSASVNQKSNIWWLAPDLLSQYGELISGIADGDDPGTMWLYPLDAWFDFDNTQ